MRIRNEYKDISSLKGMSYHLLKNLHTLGKNNKKRAEIIGRKGHDGLYLIQFLDNLSQALRCALANLQDPRMQQKVDHYFSQLDILTQRVSYNSQHSRPLRKQHISRFLSLHTATFNELKQSNVNISFGECVDKWEAAVITAVATWGNDF